MKEAFDASASSPLHVAQPATSTAGSASCSGSYEGPGSDSSSGYVAGSGSCTNSDLGTAAPTETDADAATGSAPTPILPSVDALVQTSGTEQSRSSTSVPAVPSVRPVVPPSNQKKYFVIKTLLLLLIDYLCFRAQRCTICSPFRLTKGAAFSPCSSLSGSIIF